MKRYDDEQVIISVTSNDHHLVALCMREVKRSIMNENWQTVLFASHSFKGRIIENVNAIGERERERECVCVCVRTWLQI